MTQPTPATGADVRLFGAALGAWAASLAGLFLPAWACAAMAGAAAVGAAATSAPGPGRLRPWRRAGRHAARRPLLRWSVAALLLGAVCGAVATGARVWLRDAEPVATLVSAQASADVELTITSDPRPLSGSRPGPRTVVIDADLDHIAVEHAARAAVAARVVVFGSDPAWATLLPSQRVAARVRFDRPRGGDLTAAALSATGAPRLLGPPSPAQSLAGRLRAGLQVACAGLPRLPGGLLPGLVIGDTSRLDPGLAEQFRTTGLTHLTAVSGANLAIILSVVLFVARWCRAGPWLSAVACAAALVGFVVLARPSPSVLRAAAMGAVALLALASGRVRAATPALAAAVLGCLLLDPALAADAGFALSVAATGALVLLAPRWRDALVRRGLPHGLAEALAVPAAAQVACGPVIVALSGQVSLVAVPANLFAAPAVAPATLLGVAATVVSPLWPDAAALLAWFASWPARYLVEIATVGARIPAASIPWPGGVVGGIGLAALTVGLLVAARRPAARRLLVVAAVAVVVGAVPLRWIAPGWPPDGAVIVACAVGQGDALVLPTGAGEGVLVDAGPDPEAVDGCLRRLGIRVLDAVLLTHFHADHVGGIAGVLRGRTPGLVGVPAYAEPAAGAELVRTALAGAAVAATVVAPGWSLRRGSLSLRAVGPSHRLTGTRSDPNNNSVLLVATNGGATILLLGDAETEEQHDLLGDGDPALSHVDVLKVAHHGSAFQDPDLMATVRPRVALVSVGAENPYGHPNPGVLAALRRAGATVLRTDQDGDVAVVHTAAGLGVAIRGSPLSV